ncbi:PREDICTED: peroxidase P7-like [Nelumbo nucifera]|uniref:Peroxidase n=2 Tax=Nelumbo nucifera TaxID=4432 RepID=A0A1U8AAI8_NELNU|nr:PREDICTED: peroxidase P7-like [Nelumbo nucifera]DAD28174.1 TPA_asm: hypothetical protein HUJ06_029642 [Nelumbo nucifera]
MAAPRSLFMCFVVLTAIVLPSCAQLVPDFYDQVCPQALPTIRTIVEQAIEREPRMGASLLRLHFHDCFVNGCDGSVLLDDTPDFIGEKTANPNNNSIRGFEVVDEIKAAVDSVCYGNVVSCADILAVAARDSVATLGGPSYQVLVGRRDSRTASRDDANNNIPAPFQDFQDLLSKFNQQGLSLEDLVVLSGGHTIGLARCFSFRDRIYNDTNIDSGFAGYLRTICPQSGGDDVTQPLDDTTADFDTVYFSKLLQTKGLLHSDQQLFKGDGSASDGLVRYYSNNPQAFWADFGVAMIKMGNIKPLTGTDGEIRMNCRKRN